MFPDFIFIIELIALHSMRNTFLHNLVNSIRIQLKLNFGWLIEAIEKRYSYILYMNIVFQDLLLYLNIMENIILNYFYLLIYFLMQ